MKQTPLKAKDVNKEIAHYKVELSKKDTVVLAEEGERKFIIVNKQKNFFYHGERIVPTLRLLQRREMLKKIVVDMGAIKFVIKGADIMRPGIKKINHEIKKDEFIVVVDEKNDKPLAVGIALFNGKEIEQQTSGKVIKNIHYVGDDIWNA